MKKLNVTYVLADRQKLLRNELTFWTVCNVEGNYSEDNRVNINKLHQGSWIIRTLLRVYQHYLLLRVNIRVKFVTFYKSYGPITL